MSCESIPAEQQEGQPVHGLVDSRRAAALLGVSTGTFKVWASRSHTATSGIASMMPAPVATFHGQVYRAEEIEEFGRQIAFSARAPRTDQRSLGAYFTPDSAADLMVGWAIQHQDDIVLEPSVGEGQFALAAQRLAASRGWKHLQVHACELDADTAKRAVGNGAVEPENLHIGDFLAPSELPLADAVIGNPPYIRVRELGGTLRRNALSAATASMGVEMDSSGSAWMPFVAKATAQLRRGGRLAFVLPLDFTYVKYARPLWDYLGESFGRLRVLRFRERIFSDILQNVLILLAEDRGGTTSEVELIAHHRLAELPATIGRGVSVSVADVVRGERAFQHALLPKITRDTLSLLMQHTSRADSRIKFNIGYVTGNKTFFHPDEESVRRFALPERSLYPTVASSRQLSRAGTGTSSIRPAASLWLPGKDLAAGEEAYIRHGEQEGVDMAYKCRIRSPWYRVPGVRTPDVLLTTFSDRPRLHLNDAGWMASNSVLCGYMRPGEDAQAFVDSWYTPLTLVSTELQVHSLGGGVMIAVPGEADSVQLLSRDATRPVDAEQLSGSLKSADSTAAYAAGAHSIRHLVGDDGLDALWAGAETLSAWRKAKP